jgi:hypothetical protein
MRAARETGPGSACWFGFITWTAAMVGGLSPSLVWFFAHPGSVRSAGLLATRERSPGMPPRRPPDPEPGAASLRHRRRHAGRHIRHTPHRPPGPGRDPARWRASGPLKRNVGPFPGCAGRRVRNPRVGTLGGHTCRSSSRARLRLRGRCRGR